MSPIIDDYLASKNIRFDNGNVLIGGLTNHTKIEADGTMVSIGDASCYDDWYVAGNNLDATGSASPDLVTLANGERIRTFDGANTTEILYGKVEITHDFKLNSLIESHLHMISMGTSAGVCKFFLDWNIERKNIPYNAATWTNTISNTYSIPATQYTPFYMHIGYIDSTGWNIGDIIHFRLRRVPTDSEDTYSGDVGLSDIGFHYKIDTNGSRDYTVK